MSKKRKWNEEYVRCGFTCMTEKMELNVKIIKIKLALKLKKVINCIEVFFETS